LRAPQNKNMHGHGHSKKTRNLIMKAYENMNAYYGDIHTHCGISYGHGPLEDALKNAQQQLDFCSITGHAHWPDMPEPDEKIQYILDFHHEGFARLKAGWNTMMEILKEYDKTGQTVIFPGFEIHMNSDGDRTIFYKNIEGEIMYASDLADLHQRMNESRANGVDVMSFPHHIGYRLGTRGINWETVDPVNEPFVELISMHGCSETNENTRPFLHSMGGSDWEGTIQYGLAQGKIFGFSGNTDHHSGHPGSYGHGCTGVWAEGKNSEDIWNAIRDRRTYPLTGDRIDLQFSVNGQAMGSVIEQTDTRTIEFDVQAGGAIDYIDVVKNNTVLRRFSECDVQAAPVGDTIRTKIYLELGWGERKVVTPWEVDLGITEGKILKVEPRFRGREVVSPVEQASGESEYHTSRVISSDERSVQFVTKSESNPNNMTCTTQGLCIEVEMPTDASVVATINGQKENLPIKRLIEGARTGHLGKIDSPAYRFNRAPLPHELNYRFTFEDEGEAGDNYYLRVRQKNDQWAWSSPVFVR